MRELMRQEWQRRQQIRKRRARDDSPPLSSEKRRKVEDEEDSGYDAGIDTDQGVATSSSNLPEGFFSAALVNNEESDQQPSAYPSNYQNDEDSDDEASIAASILPGRKADPAWLRRAMAVNGFRVVDEVVEDEEEEDGNTELSTPQKSTDETQPVITTDANENEETAEYSITAAEAAAAIAGLNGAEPAAGEELPSDFFTSAEERAKAIGIVDPTKVVIEAQAALLESEAGAAAAAEELLQHHRVLEAGALAMDDEGNIQGLEQLLAAYVKTDTQQSSKPPLLLLGQQESESEDAEEAMDQNEEEIEELFVGDNVWRSGWQ